MQRASLINQARVHNGYHYPRSILTALRSRVSFPRFSDEFQDAIDRKFDQYYMVGKVLGKITANQFEKFCHRISAPCEPATSRITSLVNPNLVESVYLTEEYAFDSVKLMLIMKARLKALNVEMMLQTEVIEVIAGAKSTLTARLRPLGYRDTLIDGLHHIFNCGYSMINNLNISSGIDVIPLKHEMTEMAMVEMPNSLKHCGVTIMCGPFFSFMPYPSKSCHSFSHVRYTPHYQWKDQIASQYINPHQLYDRADRKSSWPAMRRDATRYMPILEDSRYLESLWEVKTVLPRSESDDSRPILFKPHHGLKGYHCIMGGKIDNIYDAVNEIERIGLLE